MSLVLGALWQKVKNLGIGIQPRDVLLIVRAVIIIKHKTMCAIFLGERKKPYQAEIGECAACPATLISEPEHFESTGMPEGPQHKDARSVSLRKMWSASGRCVFKTTSWQLLLPTMQCQEH